MTKENRKARLRTGLFLLCGYYWCVYMSRSDSYFAPYLLVAGFGLLRFMRSRGAGECAGKRGVLAAVLAGILSAGTVLANYNLFLTDLSGVTGTLRCLAMLAAAWGGGFFFFREIFREICRAQAKAVGAAMPERQCPNGRDKWVLFGSWALVFAVYVCILMGMLYPGVLTTDSMNQIGQVLSGNYSNHHPYYHTQLIRLCVRLGMRLFGDINAGVAVYSLFSALLLSFCFAYVTFTVYQLTRRPVLAGVVLVWYLAMPFHTAYSVTMWKDVPFGAAVTIFLVSVYRILNAMDSHALHTWLLAGISALGVCLLRSNGYLAFFASAVVFVLLYGKRERGLLLLMAAALCGSFVLKHPVLAARNVPQPDTIESLSIPLQQISRVIAEGCELTQEQRTLLEQVVDVDSVPGRYSSWISDPMKTLVRERDNQQYLSKHKAEFLKLYVQLGLRHPLAYLEAWIDATRGYWNGGYDYWRWGTYVEPNEMGIVHTIRCPWLNKLVADYFAYFASSPLLQIFLCIGLYSWGLVAAAYAAAVRKDRGALFLTVLPIMVVLSLMAATPVYSEFRYAYAVFCAMPLILVTSFRTGKPGSECNGQAD